MIGQAFCRLNRYSRYSCRIGQVQVLDDIRTLVVTLAQVVETV